MTGVQTCALPICLRLSILTTDFDVNDLGDLQLMNLNANFGQLLEIPEKLVGTNDNHTTSGQICIASL